MQKLLSILAFALISAGVTLGGITFYFSQKDDHIRRMQYQCLEKVHELYAPPGGTAYSVLSYNEAFVLETSSKAQCIVQHPLK